MAFPVRTVLRPAALVGQANGRLTPGVLKATPGQAGGLTVELVEPAARAWRALTAEAKAAGHILKQSGYGCSYRSYDIQERIFLERYTTTNNGTPGRLWKGRYWYKKPGYAAAAVPGTSNHGWGLAVDTGEERDGDAGTESIDQGTLGWLLANEQRFGWSHELQSEPWHIRYFAGDRIPTAVLAYEAGLHPEPPAPIPALGGDLDIFSVTDTGSADSNFAIMPDGPVRLDPTEVVALAGAGARVVPMRNVLFQKLVKGPRYTSFQDAPKV